MITSSYVRTMAAYNSEMNRRLYEAAGRLPDDIRREDGGAFFKSIHATLNHLLWADQMWMSRFDGWEKPGVTLKDSGRFVEDFEALHAGRRIADDGIEAWAAVIDDDWLAGELTWFSGAAQRQFTARRDGLMVHVFNHQIHHRGQVHALLTRAGETTGDTDLWLVVPERI